MSSLPRNVRAKNANIHKKFGVIKEINRKMSELETVCDKHKVGNLSLGSCKYASVEGNVTYVEQEFVRGNMRSGILVIRAKAITPAPGMVYDVVEISNAKQERDEKKRKEDDEKAITELERLQKANAINTLPEGNEQHEELVKKLVEKSINPDQEESVENVAIKEEKMANLNEESIKTNNPSGNKKEQAIKRMNEQLAQKTQSMRNKYYRNFMKDLQTKFILAPIPNVKYFEVKAETTLMIIEDAEIYKINMPSKVSDTYLLIIGDLQMKSMVLRRIDPTYASDKVLLERSDFLERIKARENAKVTEYNEELDFDEMEELGLPNDDENESKI